MEQKLDFSILKTLTELPGISGRESAVRSYLKDLLSPYADDVRTDVMGNLIFFKKALPIKICFYAPIWMKWDS